ncbi:MAG: hypothetical protein ACP5RS_03820 [Thermoplasmata archaeon]
MNVEEIIKNLEITDDELESALKKIEHKKIKETEIITLYKEALEKKEELNKKMKIPFELDSELSKLRYEYFNLLAEAKALSINLTGTIAESFIEKKIKTEDEKKVIKSDKKLTEKYIFHE